MKIAVTVSDGSAPSGVGPSGHFRDCAVCGDLCQLLGGVLVRHDIGGVECGGSGRLPRSRQTADDYRENARRRRVRVTTGSTGVCAACHAEHLTLRGSLVFHNSAGGQLCDGSGQAPRWVRKPPRAA